MWDWRNEVLGLVNGNINVTSPDPFLQFDISGDCMRSTVFAVAQMFAMRLHILLLEQHHIYFPLKMLWRSSLCCQSFDGGGANYGVYASLEEVANVGIPLEECSAASYASPNNTFVGEDALFYAKDYGFLSGPSSDAFVMREIYDGGPVLLNFFILSDTLNGHKLRDQKRMMLTVGWDESMSDGVLHQYWIARGVGDGLFRHIPRGSEDWSLRNGAWAVPDMDRLPSGFVSRARDWQNTLFAETDPDRIDEVGTW